MPYVVSPEAEEDLFQIWQYLYSKAGLETANRIQTELLHLFEALARNPGTGHKRPDLTSRAVLFQTIYQYMVIYRFTSQVEIVAVLHGKRDLPPILRDRAPQSE